MTLIVGIKSSDGIVIGADCAATLSTSSGQFTVNQDVRKIEIISDNIVIANSGQVGFFQRIRDELKNRVDIPKRDIRKIDDINKLKKEIQNIFLKVLEIELEIAKKNSNIFGNLTQSNLTNHLLLAIPFLNNPILLQFSSPNYSVEEADDKLPFISAGSGQVYADTFLSFIRDVLWKDKCPDFKESMLSLVWTLEFCTKIAPAFIREPIQIIELRNGIKGKIITREIPDEELDEHREAVHGLMNKIKEIKNEFLITNEDIDKALPKKENID